jgi:hypothetical protein
VLQISETIGTAFVRALVEADERAAEDVRRQGCPCGGRLHRADYPRKARGLPAELDTYFQSRISFCCARDGCRRRRTPPSVRFLGRRVYAALIVMMCAADWIEPLELGVPRRTLRRWRRWFRATLVRTRFLAVAADSVHAASA